jgi:threonyl-tRNA synthetase
MRIVNTMKDRLGGTVSYACPFNRAGFIFFEHSTELERKKTMISQKTDEELKDLQTLRHSASHLLAHAVKRLFPAAKLLKMVSIMILILLKDFQKKT